MTYKKLFLALPVVLGAMALTTSCSFEQDEYFDESASLRVTHQNENIKNLVKGLMIESYIEDGCQHADEMIYGKSITDPCLGWEKSERLIYHIADIL